MKNIKKFISVFLTLAIIIPAVFINGFPLRSAGNVWDGSVAAGFFKGTGSSDDPYIITTAEELAYLSQQVGRGFSYEDTYFELGADIILNDTTDCQIWGTYDENNNIIAPVNSWTPIGKYSNYAFYGNFDGKGYTVYGAYVNGVKAKFFGLFGYVGEPDSYGNSTRQTVKNLNVADSYIYGENTADSFTPRVGGVVGYGNAENCSFSGRVCGNKEDSYVGGVVGDGEAKYCTNYSTVSGYRVGGIISDGNAFYCNNYGDIYSYYSVGGINCNGYAKYCSNSGDIYAYDCSSVGGIISYSYSGSVDDTTQYCFNSGDITVDGAGYDIVGGVIGSGLVLDCFNSGKISLRSSYGDNSVGGIVGNLNTNLDISLSGCYNSGTISVDCSGDIGAIVGENDETKVEDCYYLDSAYSSDNYSEALTDAQMKSADSFKNWNFNRVWEYLEGAEYPYPTLRYFGSNKYYYSAKFRNGNGTLLSEVLAEENETITLTEPSSVAGAEFCYWENEGVRYCVGDTFVMTEDEVFYAVYKRKNTSSKVWDGSIADSFSGTGLSDDPYLITSAAELAYLAESVKNGNSYLNKFFSLTDDIYLNDASDAYSYYLVAENQWTPIGVYFDEETTAAFRGSFNGNGHTVYGLYIKSSDRYSGLFGKVSSGKIKNLNIEKSAVFCCFENYSIYGGLYGGLAVGYTDGDIENCTVSGKVQLNFNRCDYEDGYCPDLYLGGVAGYSYKTVSGCVNNAEVSLTSTGGKIENLDGDINIGGVLGRGKTVSDCVNNGAVSSFGVTTYSHSVDIYLTGIVGIAGDIDNCTNNGQISAERFYLSNNGQDSISLAGISERAENAVNCVNNADISGYGEAAGIMLSSWSSSVIEGCINKANVTGAEVGGIILRSDGILRNCENMGNLSLTRNDTFDNIGGIAVYGNNAFGCINRGNITVNSGADDYTIGGILAVLESGNNAGSVNTVSQCLNYGDIIIKSESSYGDSIGGIVGSSGEYTLVENNCFDGNITVTGFKNGSVGGIIGSGSAENCLYEGNISVSVLSHSDDVYVGGISGTGNVENSLSLGRVSLESAGDFSNHGYDLSVGAVTGNPDSAVSNSFYLNYPDTLDAYKNNSGTNGTSQTLSKKSTFADWDFNKVWEMRSSAVSSYPILRFMGSKKYMYYLEFVDEGKTISKQLLSGGSSIDFSAPYTKAGYTFAYWENDGFYYYPGDTRLLDQDGVYNAVWIYNNKGSDSLNTAVTDSQWQGSGTQTDPYLITSAEELAGLAKEVNQNREKFEGVFFKQTKDIYINDTHEYSHTVMAENTWTPIGKSDCFMGNYDGSGYTVYGIYIKSNSNYDGRIYYGGLFGKTKNCTIKNLTVDSSYLENFGNKNYSAEYGGFVGRADGGLITIENCINKAKVHSNYRTGGFVGYVYDHFIIADCQNYGEISGGNAGGFIGYAYDRASAPNMIITNSVNYGDVCDLEFIGDATGGFIGTVYADDSVTVTVENQKLSVLENKGSITCKNGFAGGIVGFFDSMGEVNNCVNNGEISAKYGGGIIGDVGNCAYINKAVNNAEVYASYTAGGIIGDCGGAYMDVEECENHAGIEGGGNTGGIVGAGSAYVSDSLNYGDVTATGSYSNVGGIVGETNSSVVNSANYGDVTATGSYSNAGGIAGYFPWNSYARATGCYNTGNITGKSDVGGIVGCNNSNSNGSITDCYNTGAVTGGSNVGGIAGDGNATNCYNMGAVTGGSNYVGGIAGDGNASYCYNTGAVKGGSYNVGGIAGDGDASCCYNTGAVTGDNYNVGGIAGYGNAAECYNIGDVYGNYYVGSIIGDGSKEPTDCYYLDSISLVSKEGNSLYYNGTAVDSATLASESLEGFDFTEVWELGNSEGYDYPTLRNTTHTVTYTVTFLDTDGTVLKEQEVMKGWSATPPKVEPFADVDYVYAIDRWDTDYRNITSDTTVRAVYKKTAKIKFRGTEHSISVPLGYSSDNLRVAVESAYSSLLCKTTNDYRMKCAVVWDFSNYNPDASGTYTLTGTLTITDSLYYEMAAEQRITLCVTVLEDGGNAFDQSHLTYNLNSDGTAVITGYTGSAEEIKIPEKLNGYKVSAIADGAFGNNTNITSVYIPSTVKTVGANAFNGCSSLVQVTFSEGLESVGEYAFADTALTSVTLPASLNSIGEKAFGCYNQNKFVEGFTVYAFKGTAAEDYAVQNSIACVTVETKTDNYTGITVVAEDGAELSVSKVTGGEYYEKASAINEGSDISLFEIKLFNESVDELQPGNMMTVRIPVPNGFAGGSKIYRINEDGSYMDMNAQLVDGMLVFNTAHLSYYAIVNGDDSVLGDTDGNGVVDASDLASLKLYLAGVDIQVANGADMNGDGNIDASDLAALKLLLSEI